MTTKTENFFAWIWRINGLLVLVVAIVCIVGLAALFGPSGVFRRGDQPKDQLTDFAGTDLVAEDLRLGEFQDIVGTDYIYATLAAPSGYGRYSSSRRGTARNLLFFNIDSRKAHWLFPDSNKEIIGQKFLYKYTVEELESDEEREKIVVGILMTLADVDGDNEPAQPKRLVLTSADGKTINVLADSIDGLLHDYHVSSASHLFFYNRQGSVHIMELNPTTATVVSDSVLSTDQ